jgi:hypothetical protein
MDGTLALVLELVEGDTLAERIDTGPLPLTAALTIALQMADALDAAHERGIVHRDLKPANIKITPAGVVKVLDFGLAKAVVAEAAGLVRKLREGLPIGRGFTHRIRELFGGPRGCTHTTALLQAMAPAVVQATWSMRSTRGAEVTDPEEREAAIRQRQEARVRHNVDSCHVWAADRAEETAPGTFRLFGCFCMPAGPATDTKVRPRLTIEVADTDSGGGLVNTFGSPHALRVDEFGTERCATFTRGLERQPDGGMVLVNTYPSDCRVELRDGTGTVVRTLFATAAGSGGTFGEDACPLLGVQRLGSGGTIFLP